MDPVQKSQGITIRENLDSLIVIYSHLTWKAGSIPTFVYSPKWYKTEQK